MNPAGKIPDSFRRTILAVHGEAGEAWLEGLPNLLDQCADRYGLEWEALFPRHWYNFLAPARMPDGRRCVLKCGVPGRGIRAEIALLDAYAGRPTVRLLASDPEIGVALLERIEPGATLVDLASDDDDLRGVQAASDLMVRLRMPPDTVPWIEPVGEWLEVFDRIAAREAYAAVAALIADARSVARELLESSPEVYLLHGDLHHQNILLDKSRGWLAIDPMGVVGEPAVEIAVFVRNLWQDRHKRTDPAATMRHRIHAFCDLLGLDRRRAHAWCFVLSMVSTAWSIEDGEDDWPDSAAITRMLAVD